MRSRTVVITAAVGFLLLTAAVLAQAGPMLRSDAAISAAAHRTALAHPMWLSLLRTVTASGSTAVLTPIVVLGCAVLLGFRRWRPVVFVAIAMPVTLLLRLVIMEGVARPRPADRLAGAAGWSYPSGHTAASATVALIAVLICWPLLTRRWSRVVLAVLAAAWAVAVGYSRVGLVVHWPSDVLGSWLLVTALVPAIAAVLDRILPQPSADPDPVSTS
jgi:undecaprenyl-diphosphatase